VADEHTVPGWHELGAKVFTEMEAWRHAHTRATFAEIEAAVEERLSTLRAELIGQEIAMKAAAEADGSERPRCPTCGQPMEARGTRERTVTVRGNCPVKLRRRYVVCPACGAGHFPPG